MAQNVAILLGKTELEARLGSCGGVRVAELAGELHSRTVQTFAALAAELLAQGEARLVLDLRRLYDVDFIGLLALRDLASSLARRGGRLVLGAVRPRVRECLAYSGMAGQLPAYLTLEDAVQAVSLSGAALVTGVAAGNTAAGNITAASASYRDALRGDVSDRRTP